jgi:hypothetical protein
MRAFKNPVALFVITTLALALNIGVSQADDVTKSTESSKNSNANNWTQPRNETQYWGNPTHNVGNDKDQSDLDAQAGNVPGLQVVSGKIFEMKSNANAATSTSSGSGQLIDHKGAVLPTAKIYSIFWGPSQTLNATYQANTANFLNGLVCSNCASGLSGMLGQYSRSASINISYGKSYVDLSNPPASSPSTTAVANEVLKVVITNAKETLDRNGIYLVFTSNFPTRASYCAWHGAATARINNVSTSFTMGYMPNLSTQLTGCGAHYLPNYTASGLGENFDSLFNVTTHELYETMSDPMTSGYGWYDAAGFENGDKCAWNWSTQISSSGKTFIVQQEYSNALKQCASA